MHFNRCQYDDKKGKAHCYLIMIHYIDMSYIQYPVTHVRWRFLWKNLIWILTPSYMFDRLLNKPLQLTWFARLRFWNCDILLFLIAKYYLLKVLLRKCRIKIITNNYSYRKYFFHPFHHKNIPEKCLDICYFNSTLKDIN